MGRHGTCGGRRFVFPAGALNTTNTNDLPAGTLFNSVTLDNPIGSYTVMGNAILLGPGGLTTSGVTLGLSFALAANQTWSFVSAGTASPVLTGAIDLGGWTLTIDMNYSASFTGPIGGSGALVKRGSQLLHLSGANTYSGPTTVEDGPLVVESPTALGVADGTPGNGTSVLGGGQSNFGSALFLIGVAVGNEAVTLDGEGWVGGGVLETGPGPTSLAGPVTLARNVMIRAGDLTLSGVVSGPGELALAGPTVLTLANGGNSFTGGVNINHPFFAPTATLVLGADHPIPGSPVIALGAGNTLVLNGHTQTLAAVTGTGRVDTSAAPGVLTLDGAGDSTFAGSVTGTGLVVHTGTGRQAFTGTSTFSGPLHVDHGIVSVSGGTLPAVVTVNDDGHLGLAANGTVGTVTVNDGRLQLTEGGAATGNAGPVTLDSAATVDIGGAAPAALGRLTVAGVVTLGGATLALQLPAGFTPAVGAAFTIVDNDGVDAVSGTFAGLPEGAIIRANRVRFHISYAGGTGNDIVLTALPGSSIC